MSISLVRSRPITAFAEAVQLYAPVVRRIFLISPWIAGAHKEDTWALGKTISALQDTTANITVLTRPPGQTSHKRAITALERLPNSAVLYLSTLHAKLYVIDGKGIKIAIFGSANFTAAGDSIYREVAADVRSVKQSDAGANFVDELSHFALELASDPNAYIHKKPGPWRER